MEREVLLEDEAATARLATDLARGLPAGSVVVLRGPLGSGKTTFVRHLARALGFTGRVTSPTYTLMHVYPTPEGPILHADLYRLDDPARVDELGLFEEAEDARLVVVEWGRPEDFPGALVVELAPVGESARRARVWSEEPVLRSLIARL